MKRIFTVKGIVLLVFMVCIVHIQHVQAALENQDTVEHKFPGLAVTALKSAKLTDLEPDILLKADGIEIRISDIDAVLKNMPPDIQKQWQKNLFFILEQKTVEKILLNHAAKSGISTEGRTNTELIQTYLHQKAGNVSVSDEDAKSFYDANKEMVGGVSFEQVKESIKEFVLNQKKQEYVDNYLSSLGETVLIQVNRNWTETQNKIVKDNPVDKARFSGKPTLAEFGATGCIPCDKMQPILDNLKKKFGDRLNVVFLHVRENPVLATRFGIRSIPVQAFYDKDGKEVFRHTGFYPEADVLKQLEKIGVK